MGNFYTYLWLREDGTPYYVGKGRGQRGFVDSGHRVNCPKDPARIILQEWPSEEDAFAAEIFLISYYGRANLGTGCLRNLTDGGEGCSGTVVSKETLRKMSESQKGKTLTPEHIAALSAGQTGKKKYRSLEHSIKIRENKKVWWAERKKKGFTASPEARAKTSESLKRYYANAPEDVHIKMSIRTKNQWEKKGSHA